jgi:hypothetical protein
MEGLGRCMRLPPSIGCVGDAGNMLEALNLPRREGLGTGKHFSRKDQSRFRRSCAHHYCFMGKQLEVDVVLSDGTAEHGKEEPLIFLKEHP